MRLRQGRKQPRNLYIQLGDEPSDDDEPLGLIIDPVRAAVLVQIANGESPPFQEPGEHSPARSLLDLGLPAPKNHGCDTVREYLTCLLESLWDGEASPKYGMTGESDWQYDLYGPMVNAGLLPGRDSYENDGYGLRQDEKEYLDALIVAAIGELRP